MKLDKPRIIVDFNEMITCNCVLLSRYDSKKNSAGSLITFHEGMPVSIYSDDDLDDEGNVTNLIADGIAIINTTAAFTYVKWLCQIDTKGIRHQADEQ